MSNPTNTTNMYRSTLKPFRNRQSAKTTPRINLLISRHYITTKKSGAAARAIIVQKFMKSASIKIICVNVGGVTDRAWLCSTFKKTVCRFVSQAYVS